MAVALRTILVLMALSVCLFDFSRDSYAGTLWQLEVTALNDGVGNAARFAGQMQDNSLFFSWTGSTVPVTAATYGNLFMDSAGLGTHLFANDFAGALVVAPRARMRLNAIVDGKLSQNTTETTLETATGTRVLTKLGGLSYKMKGDPDWEITNDGNSEAVITSFVAQINDSQNPLNISVAFMPDGTSVPVSVLIPPGGVHLLPGESIDVSFANGGNTSLLTTYTAGGDIFTDLVAAPAPVPEPTSVLLVGSCLTVLTGVAWRQLRRK